MKNHIPRKQVEGEERRNWAAVKTSSALILRSQDSAGLSEADALRRDQHDTLTDGNS